jgi:hypothetical protein
MSTKSALRADLGAEDRKTLAEDRKRMEKLGKGSQLDDWLAFGPGLLIRRRLAKNIAGLAESDPAKGHRLCDNTRHYPTLAVNVYHVASGTPVVTILRPARTPKGTEVRTVVKHVTKRLKRHWPNTRIVWRGDR